MKAFIGLLFIVGCQTAQPGSASVTCDKELCEYIDLFENYSKKYSPSGPVKVKNLTVKFGKLTYPSIGMCSFIPFSRIKEITIDPVAWGIASSVKREVLMLHELGHCILNRDHIDNMRENVPASIMYPNTTPHYFYEEKKESYLRELFSITDDWKWTDHDGIDKDN